MKILSLGLLLICISCSKKKSDLPQLIVESHDSILSINARTMMRNQSPLLAVNFTNDTTTFTDIQDMKFFYDKKFDRENIKLVHPDLENIKIIIDTSYAFSNRGFEYRFIPYLTPKEKLVPKPSMSDPVESEKIIYRRYFKQTDSIKNKYVASYPVLIYNNSKFDLYFGINPLKMIQEALDVDNKWKPIEFFYQYPSCGVASSIVDFRVQPKHYLATAIIKYTGDFKTKIRVNYYRAGKTIYSNEITGYINRSQFNIKPAKDYSLEMDGATSPEWEQKELDWMFNRPQKRE